MISCDSFIILALCLMIYSITEMDPELYDEFGNYIGPELESEDDSDSEEEQREEEGVEP